METISMSKSERKRLAVMSQVVSGKLSLQAASGLLGLSYRQTKRVLSKYRAEGDQGVVHGLRGKASNRPTNATLKAQVLSRYVASYSDYGPTLAVEALAGESLVVPVATLRRWLREAGLWARRRERKQHRKRRVRREAIGELLQMDGSHHDWFEGRRDWAVLMVAIDDASGRILARFFEEETLAAAFTMMQIYIIRHGLPQAVYVDRASIYRSDREPTEEEIVNDLQPQTQFGRAMESLAVRLILARSPQAKGRVERMNGTLQDRLVKALRQKRISDLSTANSYLEAEFLDAFNAKFSKTPEQSLDGHRPLSAEQDLNRTLSVQEERVVQNDWTVRWQNGFLQLRRNCGVEPKQRVVVCSQLDGRVRIFTSDRELDYGTSRTEPPTPPKPKKGSALPKSNQGQKPPASHPWRGKAGRINHRPTAPK